jgi:hypothetical protein
MQSDGSPVVQVSSKIVGGVGPNSAHMKNGVTYVTREAIDVIRIPGIVMGNPGAKGECSRAQLNAEEERQDAGHKWVRLTGGHLTIASKISGEMLCEN